MKSSARRFEFLLPLRFNDGQPVPDEFIGEVIQSVRKQFGAVSVETQTIRGLWQHSGQEHRDELCRVFVDVADLPENRQFFLELKEVLKAKFRQTDIWMTTHPIEIL